MKSIGYEFIRSTTLIPKKEVIGGMLCLKYLLNKKVCQALGVSYRKIMEASLKKEESLLKLKECEVHRS